MIAIVRTLIVSVLIGAGLVSGFFFLLSDQKQRQIEELEAINAELDALAAKRQAMIDRLSRSRRVAHLHVTGQTRDEAGEVIATTIEFIELDEQGSELARQTFEIPGDVVYVDAWTVKFDAEDVAAGHPMRGQTLLLLRRVYSEQLAPQDGHEIDTPGAVPAGYAVGEVGRHEQRIWELFWQIATDAALARNMGVRVAQGEAVYKPVLDGQVYELVVDAAGGMSLVPLDDGAPEAPPDETEGGEGGP